MQQVLRGLNTIQEAGEEIRKAGYTSVLLVSGSHFDPSLIAGSIEGLVLRHYIKKGINVMEEEISDVMQLFDENRNAAILAIGGGSVIDAGKATEKDFAEVVARSRRNALGNPYAQIKTALRVEDLLNEDYDTAPLRRLRQRPVVAHGPRARRPRVHDRRQLRLPVGHAVRVRHEHRRRRRLAAGLREPRRDGRRMGAVRGLAAPDAR